MLVAAAGELGMAAQDVAPGQPHNHPRKVSLVHGRCWPARFLGLAAILLAAATPAASCDIRHRDDSAGG